jgi:2-methylisocitrate lyase-like PEP mutase family enzyme
MTGFAALHVPGRPLVLPNAWDYASAAALVRAGFAAIGTTSLGVAAAHGLPDAHGAARAETVALARQLRRLGCLYTVDIEGGFGAAADVAAELADLGASGVNVEDGRPGGTLAPPDQQAELIGEIVERVPGLFVNARTDTHWLNAHATLDEAIARARVYAAAGAHGIFVPGMVDLRDIAAVVAAVPLPVNVLAGSRAVAELAAAGAARVSTGSLLFRAALHAAVSTARAVASGAPVAAGIPDYAEVDGLASVRDGSG